MHHEILDYFEYLTYASTQWHSFFSMEKPSYKVEEIGIPESLWKGKLPTQQGRSHLLCEQNIHLHCVKPPTLSVIPNQWFPKCDPGTSSLNITWEFGTHSNWAKL